MYIKVRVKTGQRKEMVEQASETSFRISVKEKPERNSANARVIRLVASALGVPAKKVRIVSGHHASSKLMYTME